MSPWVRPLRDHLTALARILDTTGHTPERLESSFAAIGGAPPHAAYLLVHARR